MPIYQPEPVTAGTDETGEDRPKKQYNLIPAGTWLDASVLSVEEVTENYTDKDTGLPVKKVEFTFGITWEGDDRKAWGKTSNKWVPHPGCRLRQWAQEIFAADLPEEFVLNTDHLVGEKCQVLMGVRTWEAGTNSETGRSWNAGSKNFVEDVKRASASAPAPAKRDEPFEDPF